MKSDITRDLLLRAGFKLVMYNKITKKKMYYMHFKEPVDTTIGFIRNKLGLGGREWFVDVIYGENRCTDCTIQTIEQFNSLMKILDSDYRLKEEKK